MKLKQILDFDVHSGVVVVVVVVVVYLDVLSEIYFEIFVRLVRGTCDVVQLLASPRNDLVRLCFCVWMEISLILFEWFGFLMIRMK